MPESTYFTNPSVTSLLFSPTPITPPHLLLLLLSIQKGTGLSWARTKHSISSWGRTELLPLYEGGWGNPAWETGSQRSTKCQGQVMRSWFTARRLTNRTSYTTVLGLFHAGSLSVGPESMCYHELLVAVFVDFSVMTLSTTVQTIRPVFTRTH